MPPPSGKTRRNTSTLTMILAIVALFALLGFGYYIFNERAHRAEYNRIVNDFMDEQKFQEAIAPLRSLIAKASGDVRTEATHSLGSCYAHLGDDPSLPLQKRAELFKQAKDIDPTSLNEQQRNELQAAEKMAQRADTSSP